MSRFLSSAICFPRFCCKSGHCYSSCSFNLSLNVQSAVWCFLLIIYTSHYRQWLRSSEPLLIPRSKLSWTMIHFQGPPTYPPLPLLSSICTSQIELCLSTYIYIFCHRINVGYYGCDNGNRSSGLSVFWFLLSSLMRTLTNSVRLVEVPS